MPLFSGYAAGWQDVLIFANSWVNSGSPYAPAGYSLLDGVVRLRGVVKNGAFSGSAQIFLLPAGFRPPVKKMFPVLCASGSTRAIGQVDVDTSGNVIAVSGSNSFLSLDSISFRVF